MGVRSTHGIRVVRKDVGISVPVVIQTEVGSPTTKDRALNEIKRFLSNIPKENVDWHQDGWTEFKLSPKNRKFLWDKLYSYWANGLKTRGLEVTNYQELGEKVSGSNVLSKNTTATLISLNSGDLLVEFWEISDDPAQKIKRYATFTISEKDQAGSLIVEASDLGYRNWREIREMFISYLEERLPE